MRRNQARFATAIAIAAVVGPLAPIANAAQVGPLKDWECTVTPTDAEVAAVSQMYVNHNRARELYESAYLNGYEAIYPGTRKVIEAAWADPAVIAAVDEFLAADAADVFELTAQALEKNSSLTDEYAKRLATETGMPEDVAEEAAHFFSAHHIDVLTDKQIASELNARSYAPDVSTPVILSTTPDASLTDKDVRPDRDAMLAHAKQRAERLRGQATLATSTWTFAPSFLTKEQKQLFDEAAFAAPDLEDFYADEHTLKLMDTELRIACLEGGNTQVDLPTSYRFEADTADTTDTNTELSPGAIAGIVLGTLAGIAALTGAVAFFAPAARHSHSTAVLTHPCF